MSKAMILNPGAVSLTQLQRIYETACPVKLHDTCVAGITASRAAVEAAAAGDDPVYGINTGFGKLASTQIKPEETATLQRNLILSHCCGVGQPIPDAAVHMMIALKLISFGRGASGVRPKLVALLENMLAHGVYPVIPAQGSVGASGDLAPLAHMAAVMIGEGEARIKGDTMPGLGALKMAGLEPIELSAKEGLALINGTQFSTAMSLIALFRAWRNMQTSLLASCLSTDAIMGSTAPLHPAIHDLRGHAGQIETAATMRALLDGSAIRESHMDDDDRVQDPYCIRCQPQVTGAAMDMLRYVGQTLRTEANAATDNPLVAVDEGLILSGGNFHAEPVAFAADQMALAIAEIGAISQRRIAMTVDPALSFGLPAFLSPAPGLNSGYMIAEVTSAALMSENKQKAHPASIDSTPTSANQEDHVSMAAHGAVRLGPMNDNLAQIIGIELLTGAQGVEFRAPLGTSMPLRQVIGAIRRYVPTMGDDRFMAGDLETAAALVNSGSLIKAAGENLFPALEPPK